MDRNGKKAKATTTASNPERSDLKAQAHLPMGALADARPGAPNAAPKPPTSGKHARRTHRP